MLEPGFLIQLVTFITSVLILNFLELRRPGFAVNRKRDLAINLAAMFIVVFGGEHVKAIASKGLQVINLAAILRANALSLMPGWEKIPVAIVLTDFSLYWVHRAMHGRLLWPTHRFHHSIPEIWWLAGARTSLTHLLFFAVPQVLISNYLLRMNPLEMGVGLSFGIFVNLWIHANIWINLGPFAQIFGTPNFHRIHHGGAGLNNRNLGFVLTLWDRLFGTYLDMREVGKTFPINAVPTGKQLWRQVIGV